MFCSKPFYDPVMAKSSSFNPFKTKLKNFFQGLSSLFYILEVIIRGIFRKIVLIHLLRVERLKLKSFDSFETLNFEKLSFRFTKKHCDTTRKLISRFFIQLCDQQFFSFPFFFFSIAFLPNNSRIFPQNKKLLAAIIFTFL